MPSRLAPAAAVPLTTIKQANAVNVQIGPLQLAIQLQCCGECINSRPDNCGSRSLPIELAALLISLPSALNTPLDCSISAWIVLRFFLATRCPKPDQDLGGDCAFGTLLQLPDRDAHFLRHQFQDSGFLLGDAAEFIALQSVRLKSQAWLVLQECR